MQLPFPTDQWPALRTRLSEGFSRLHSQLAMTGFDGFIDRVHRIIREKNESGIEYVNSSSEWASYIQQKKGSFSMETVLRATRPGGNAPLLSMALGNMQLRTHAIGAYGWPRPHSAFGALPPSVHLFSYAEPGTCDAYEFNDGKIMLADMGELNNSDWSTLKARIGLEKMQEACGPAQLYCLLNWSELDSSPAVWEGFWTEILEPQDKLDQKYCFTDLSDFSKRTAQDLDQLVNLLRQISRRMKLILGLNKNECRMLFHFLGGDKNVEGLEEMGRTIADRLTPYCLLLHDDRNALAIQTDQVAGWSSFYSPEPATLTGAGDHLGAGFCLGQLMQLSLSDSVFLGNAMAGCWVHKGVSANQTELLDFLDRLFDK
jgi:hypothetical protein